MIVGFPNQPAQYGGPGSFQRRFENEVKKLGWQVVYPEDNIKPDVILILGGTRKLLWLLRMKRKGAVILFRLGGINWLYKHKQVSWHKKFYLSLQIHLTPFIQAWFANGIIYQSKFSREWLIRLKQSANVKNDTIIYNGVDLEEFKPAHGVNGKRTISLLCVEGNIDYSPYTINLLNQLQEKLVETGKYRSILLYGNFENQENKRILSPKIDYRGYVSGQEISKIYRDAVYLSLDVNAACPNTVIESLSSGIPVIGFDTGALNELVPPEAGEIVPYGGDPWKLDFPDINALIDAAGKILNNYAFYSENARKIAEKHFDVTYMVLEYLSFVSKNLKQ